MNARPFLHQTKISILLPVHNGADFLQIAVESILKQTYNYWELIVIDDGSTDNTFEILSQFRDPRIHVYQNQSNIGITSTLNRALDLAKGDFIARLDADDTAHPERLTKQLKYLETHPQIALVASWANVLPSNEVWRTPLTPQHVEAELLFRNCLFHSTLMWRSHLKLKYDESFRYTQDYELTSRLVAEKKQIAVIPEPLVTYLAHDASISSKFNQEQYNLANQVRRRMLHRIGITPTETELILHAKLATEANTLTQEQATAAMKWLERIWGENEQAQIYARAELMNVISTRVKKMLQALPNLHVRINMVRSSQLFTLWQKLVMLTQLVLRI